MPMDMLNKRIGKMGMTETGDDKPKKPDAMDMGSSGSTTLALDKYPELQGMAKGDKISGKWEGVIDQIDTDNATISYTSLNLETENTADKEMERIMGSQKPKAENKVGDEADEQDL